MEVSEIHSAEQGLNQDEDAALEGNDNLCMSWRGFFVPLQPQISMDPPDPLPDPALCAVYFRTAVFHLSKTL